jgi:hypothetical protein
VERHEDQALVQQVEHPRRPWPQRGRASVNSEEKTTCSSARCFACIGTSFQSKKELWLFVPMRLRRHSQAGLCRALCRVLT